MPEKVMPGPVSDCNGIREAVCIHTTVSYTHLDVYKRQTVLRRKLYLVRRRGSLLSPAAQAFCDFARGFYQRS